MRSHASRPLLFGALVAGAALAAAGAMPAAAVIATDDAEPQLLTVADDPTLPVPGSDTQGQAEAAAAGLVAADVAVATASAADPHAPTLTLKPDADFVALSSKPGASKTIWLVFGGGELTGTEWNVGRHPVDTPNEPAYYRPVTDPIDFSAAGPAGLATPAMRTEIFERVSELFSPFDVNVTTVRPADTDLSKDSATDERYGGVALFTNDMFSTDLQFDDADDANGIAHFDTFGDPTDYYAWITTGQIDNTNYGNPKVLAGIAAHEVGHTLALGHQGNSGSPDPLYRDYYMPAGLWAPIMGKGLDAGIVRWAQNTYPNAYEGQDDLAVMTDPAGAKENTRMWVPSEGNRPIDENDLVCSVDDTAWLADASLDDPCDGIDPADRVAVLSHTYYVGRVAYDADDHGDVAGSATALELNGTREGIIERNSDVDAFSLTLPRRGDLTLSVTTAQHGPTLDVLMTVRDANGAVVGSFDPALKLVKTDPYGDSWYPSVTGTNAEGTLTLPAGTYTVTIDGTGFGDMADVTWDDSSRSAAEYGSLGRYTLTSSFVPDPTDTPSPTPTPTVEPTVEPTTEPTVEPTTEPTPTPTQSTSAPAVVVPPTATPQPDTVPTLPRTGTESTAGAAVIAVLLAVAGAILWGRGRTTRSRRMG